MAVLFTSSDRNVIVVVNARGYRRLKRHLEYEAQLINDGMDPITARAEAGHKYPHPPMISFASDVQMPLRSKFGQYGHGGYLPRLRILIEAGNHVPHRTDFPVYNSTEWNLPVPTTEDFIKIFGRSARKILRGD